jgi:hypothetical protein
MIILEWYDGVVRAVITEDDISYLLTLVAWEVNSPRKVFILTEVTTPFEETLERLAQETENQRIKSDRWNEFRRSFEEYLSNYQGTIYLTFGEPTVGNAFSATAISSEHLNRVKNYSVESAIALEAISFWFELAGVPH